MSEELKPCYVGQHGSCKWIAEYGRCRDCGLRRTPNPEAEALAEAVDVFTEGIYDGDGVMFLPHLADLIRLRTLLQAYRAKHPKEGSAAKESGSSQKLEE